MSAPRDLEHVPEPPWLGEALRGYGGDSTAAPDNFAASADVGGLGAADLGLGDAGDLTFNLAGAAGTALSQYQQSLIAGNTRWEQAIQVFEAAAAAYLDVQLGQISPVVPVADTFLVRPAFRALGIDFSIGDTVSGLVRAASAVVLHETTGRREALARLRARAEMGGMGSAARTIAETVNWLRRLRDRDAQ